MVATISDSPVATIVVAAVAVAISTVRAEKTPPAVDRTKVNPRVIARVVAAAAVATATAVAIGTVRVPVASRVAEPSELPLN